MELSQYTDFAPISVCGGRGTKVCDFFESFICLSEFYLYLCWYVFKISTFHKLSLHIEHGSWKFSRFLINLSIFLHSYLLQKLVKSMDAHLNDILIATPGVLSKLLTNSKQIVNT